MDRLFIYAQAAPLVFPTLFFPSTNPTAAIIASFATFGVGYVARPVWGFVLGGHAVTHTRSWRRPRLSVSVGALGREHRGDDGDGPVAAVAPGVPGAPLDHGVALAEQGFAAVLED